MSQATAIGMPRVPSIVRLLNPVIRRLLGVGLPFGPNVLLTVRGRSSGRAHTFPVAIIELDGRRYVQSPFGEVNWVRNLRVAGEAILHRGDEQETVDAVEVAPEDGGPILRDAFARYLESRLLAPAMARFFGVRRNSAPEEFVEVARAHPMFELCSRGS